MDLLAEAQAGDLTARDALIAEWLPTVLGWCRRLGGPRVDAEDAAQDVLLVALDRLDAVMDADRLGAWLYGITRRVLAAHRRRAWVRRWACGAEVVGIDPGPRPDRGCEMSEIARLVQDALEELPAAQREAVVLCDVEGRTASEAAELVGVSEGTIRSRLRLARERLRRRLAPHRDVGIVPMVMAA